MQIKVDKNRLKIAAENLIQEVYYARERLKKEAIDIILTQPTKKSFFKKSREINTIDDATRIVEEFDKTGYWNLNQILNKESLYNRLTEERINYKTIYQAVIHLANSLIWACNNSGDGIVILNKKEIECFESWEINI